METNGDGRPLPKSGLYRQKETGVEQILTVTPGLGSPMIDAFVKAGFEYVGDPPVKPVSDTKVIKEKEIK